MSSPSDDVCHNLEVRILEQSDDLSAFNCSEEDIMGLNEFIHSEALQFQEENLGVTYLLLHADRSVGFATLAMSQIEIKLTPLSPLPFKATIKYFPALEIGRLAIDNTYRKRDVGRCVCLWCINKAQHLAREVGCRLIVVLTEGKPVDFYKKCGFEVVPRYESKQRKWMYLPVPIADDASCRR